MNKGYLFISGTALKEVGDALCQLSEIKDSLDVGVKQDFLDPLQQLCEKDIKEVMVCLVVILLQFNIYIYYKILLLDCAACSSR